MTGHGLISQILLKIGFLAVLAGAIPPAVHVYDLLTCERASAVITAGRPFGTATVVFQTSDGKTITAKAKPHHTGRRSHAVGDTVDVIYRVSKPTSLAPHRKVQDSLMGLGAVAFGVVLLLLRGALSKGPRPASRSQIEPATLSAERARPSPTPVASGGQSARIAMATASTSGYRPPRRQSAVQRERGWFG